MLDRILMGAAADDKLFVEDVFSTYLYTGNGSTQTITTGIDLAGKGGMLWIKNRSSATNNIISDTVRGAGNFLMSNASSQQFFNTDNVSALSSTGFSVGVDSNTNGTAGNNYASWTFREAPKFFDVVTWTGTGSDRSIAHNLGIAPGCIIIKRTDTTGDWWVYHRSTPNYSLKLNSNAAQVNQGGLDATSTTFTLYDNANVNASGGTYVAYLYAHDTASDGVIQCGSFTSNSSGVASVDLGWEPQWVLLKPSSTTGNWFIFDNMRGWSVGSSDDAALFPDRSNAEIVGTYGNPTATGFELNGWYSSATSVYIAIRRGPMKTPTLGTSVFSAITQSSGANPRDIDVGINPDLMIAAARSGGSNTASDRLRGDALLVVNSTSAGATGTTQTIVGRANNSVRISSANITGFATTDSVFWNFRRAPSFMDVVCYTGTGAGVQTLSHNLGVTPELIILKRRQSESTIGWPVAANITPTNFVLQWLNLTDGGSSASYSASTVFSAQPTASQFSVGSNTDAGASGPGYIAYLFASCPSVSKVGSYTGNGSSQTINCGFAAGARFVMIKRTDSAGDWYVWDTARGIVAGNDPHRSLNTTAAEVTSNDTVDTDSSGFVVNQVAATNVNVSSATYIYLAIA